MAKVRELFVRPTDESALYNGAIKGILDALHDPYSSFLDAQQLAEMDTNLQGKVTGIGPASSRTGTSPSSPRCPTRRRSRRG